MPPAPVVRCFVSLCLMCVCAYSKHIDGMLADESNNKIEEIHASKPIDMCSGKQPTRSGHVDSYALKDRLDEFLFQLAEVAEVAQDEMNNITKTLQCDINPRHYRKYGIRELNPRSGKKRNRKLKIPKTKQAKQLLEVSWWLTSMSKSAHEIQSMGRLSKGSILLKDLRRSINSLQDILYLMNIAVPRHSTVCYREQTINFPVKDYSRVCKYGYLVTRDITCGLKHLVDTLKRCKIAVRKRRGKTVPRLRCKKVKSVFYKKRGKKSFQGCEFRRKLGSWLKIR